MRFAFISDPIETLEPSHSTTVSLMESTQILGHEVFFTQFNKLSLVHGKVLSLLQKISLIPCKIIDNQWITTLPWYELGEASMQLLENMDAVFIRTDPPFNTNYLHATYILDYIDSRETFVINSPDGLRKIHSKLHCIQYTNITP